MGVQLYDVVAALHKHTQYRGSPDDEATVAQWLEENTPSEEEAMEEEEVNDSPPVPKSSKSSKASANA